jgi:hypothetical protein
LIWVTFNESDQRIHIHIEYFSCNRFALNEIFFQKFLRVLHFDDNDDEDEIHINSKKRFVLLRKEDCKWTTNEAENLINKSKQSHEWDTRTVCLEYWWDDLYKAISIK